MNDLTNNQDAHRSDFLSAMSNVANSVTVVTTDGEAGMFGATVSSFCSVSADPPTVLVCLNKDGNTSSAVGQNGVFCVNVLPESASELAMIFARHLDADQIDKFADPEWDKASGVPPFLKNVTAFQCEVIESVSASSHFIYIGRVISMEHGSRPPLIYLNRKFLGTSTLPE